RDAAVDVDDAVVAFDGQHAVVGTERGELGPHRHGRLVAAAADGEGGLHQLAAFDLLYVDRKIRRAVRLAKLEAAVGDFFDGADDHARDAVTAPGDGNVVEPHGE